MTEAPIGIYGCAATCMDGRIQAAVRKHLKAKKDDQAEQVDYVDIVAQPGMNKFLAECNALRFSWAWLVIYCLTLQLKKVYRFIILVNFRWMIGISVLNHNAKILAIVGHPQCAGNTCDKEKQIAQLHLAKKVVKSFGFEVDIILLWVREDWKTIEVIDANGSASQISSYDVYTAQKR